MSGLKRQEVEAICDQLESLGWLSRVQGHRRDFPRSIRLVRVLCRRESTGVFPAWRLSNNRLDVFAHGRGYRDTP
jgi:hypothetical protein